MSDEKEKLTPKELWMIWRIILAKVAGFDSANYQVKANEFIKKEDFDLIYEIEEQSKQVSKVIPRLLRPNGEPVPEHWSIYTTDEEVTIKGYRWKIVHIGEKHLLLEPIGPVLIGEDIK